MNELISSRAFRDAAAAGALTNPTVLGVDGGYILLATFGQTLKQLSARSSNGSESRRVFTSLQSAATFLQNKVGILSYQVDATGFKPGAPAPRYQNAAQRLREAHAAARHAHQPQS
jgi:hypothetical protein